MHNMVENAYLRNILVNNYKNKLKTLSKATKKERIKERYIDYIDENGIILIT